MKSVLAILLAMLIAILFTTSCIKRNSETSEIVKEKSLSEYLGKPIKVDIKGSVLDTNLKPIDSVTIIIGNKKIFTDKEGNFMLKNATAHENFLSIEIKKDGYKKTFIDLTPKENTNLINIILHKETEICLFWFCKNNHNLN